MYITNVSLMYITNVFFATSYNVYLNLVFLKAIMHAMGWMESVRTASFAHVSYAHVTRSLSLIPHAHRKFGVVIGFSLSLVISL